MKTIGKDDDKIVTADKKRGIRHYFWAEDNRTLLYLQDNDGDENFHVYGVDLATGNVRDFTPFQGVRAEHRRHGSELPRRVLVALNAARPRSCSTSTASTLTTGALMLDTENPGDVAGWLTDAEVPGPRRAGGHARRRHGDPRPRRREVALADRGQGRARRDPDLRRLHHRRQVAVSRSHRSAATPRGRRRARPSPPATRR